MANPFEKRATEYFREPESFLAIVSAEPLNLHFRRFAQEERLFDRLVKIIGTPGSGKTTLAMLFQFDTLVTLLRNKDLENRKPLISSLAACGATNGKVPTLLGCRLAMEAEYRELWELPYADELKFGLLAALIQARAVLTWFHNLTRTGYEVMDISAGARDHGEAGLRQIGGTDVAEIQKRARTIEQAIYEAVAALVPPSVDAIDEAAVSAYRPFDVIETINVRSSSRTSLSLQPLIILDDAHLLHRAQLQRLERWLVRRDLHVARWIITRPDSLSAEEALMRDAALPRNDEATGLDRDREITRIWLQQPGDLANQRRLFRNIARDIADRYLAQMPEFLHNDIRQLQNVLASDVMPLKSGQIEKLREDVRKEQIAAGISSGRRERLERSVASYLRSAKDPTELGEDVQLAMLRILMHRYVKRVPQHDLFEKRDPEPARPLKVDASVAEGARIHLLHEFRRPYYFGLDKICDASSQNAETFLRLCARLVHHAEMLLMRRRGATLSSEIQHRLLQDAARQIIDNWDFPHQRLARRLADAIAAECVEESLAPNAWLGGGANAVGILQSEYEQIHKTHPQLATVLHFGAAYNAFLLVPNRSVKNQSWCLIELGGLHILQNGLTLARGGFLERNADYLATMVETEER